LEDRRCRRDDDGVGGTAQVAASTPVAEAGTRKGNQEQVVKATRDEDGFILDEQGAADQLAWPGADPT
jgi:hypothetical protein